VAFFVMAAFLYILFSQSRDRYYVGATIDLDRRLLEHNSGKSKSTKSGIPWKLVFSQAHQTFKEARQHEAQIKKMKSRSYIESLIKP